MQWFASLALGFVALMAAAALADGGEDTESEPLLAVAANRFGSTFELITIDAQGKNAMLSLPFRAPASNPCWSADGRKVAYRSNKSGRHQLYVYDFDRGEEIRLTNTTAEEHEPTWSPDGKKLISTSLRTGDHEIFIMNADGSNPLNLTNHPGFDSDPAWSPDGRKIAFGAFRNEGWRLYVMDADGSHVRDVLGHNLDGWTGPSWSPDGTQIVYVGPNKGSLQIFVVSADGTGAEPITESAGGNAWPAFSPDGRYIAYLHYDARPENSGEQGTLMVYDVETLSHTPIAPEGMRCLSRISWKQSASELEKPGTADE